MSGQVAVEGGHRGRVPGLGPSLLCAAPVPDHRGLCWDDADYCGGVSQGLHNGLAACGFFRDHVLHGIF